MRQTRKILRISGWVIAGLCVVVLIPAAAIRVDHYLLRRDAERLLADLKSLEMRKSTYQDARRVIDRWDDHMHQEGPCQPYWCDVRIDLSDFFQRHYMFLVSHQSLVRAYQLLGGRPALIDSCIRVRNNIVWGEGISSHIAVAVRGQDGEHFYFTVIGSVGSGSRIGPPRHPEYGVHSMSGCTLCSDTSVVFSPYADPADVKRLMDVNFSCLTSWRPCETTADILPTAWNEAMAEKRPEWNPAQRTCPPEIIRLQSRESIHVAIGEVSKTEVSDGYGRVMVRLKQDLKPWSLRYRPALENYAFSELLPLKKKPGDSVVFFQFPNRADGGDAYDTCKLLPATPENMEVVRRGISEDSRDYNADFLLSPGLGDVKPPNIQVR
jgi:hypothetical protein